MPRKKVPKECGCGCRQVTQGGKFMPGHYKRDAQSKERLQRSLRRFYADNPEARIQAGINMRSGITEESEKRRIESSNRRYNSMTAEERQKFSDHAKRLWNEQKDKMRAGVEKANATKRDRQQQYIDAGGHGSDAWRQKISETVTQLYLDGGIEWSKGEYIAKSGERYWYRSSWELQRMQEFDSDPDILEWDHEPFSIPFLFEGKKKKYLPDFIVRYADGSTVIEEVGVKTLKQSIDKNVAKAEAARAYCAERGYEYRVWQPPHPGGGAAADPS